MNSRGGKKDLTSIEDLGEFVHEVDETGLQSQDALHGDLPDELPDLPASDEPLSFDPGGLEFGSGDDLAVSEFSSEELGPETGPPSDLEEESSFDQNDPFAEQDTTPDSFEEITSNDPLSSDGSSWNLGDEAQVASKIDEDPLDLSFTAEAEVASSISEPTALMKTEIPVNPITELESQYKTPETFSDLRTFSESSSFSGAAVEGNPSFSVLVKNIRYLEDIDDILTLLRELKLLADPEEQVKGRLMRGTLLIPRVSEFVATLLAHKMRRFDLDLLVGLSDEIHPPKHQEPADTGIVSRHNLYQNQSHSFQFDDARLEIGQIIVAATSSLDGHQVVKYLGVASEHKILDGQLIEDEGSSEVPLLYQELAQKLRAHALKARANAIVGLNYQLTPIPTEFGARGNRYRLTCTGNLVWVNKL